MIYKVNLQKLRMVYYLNLNINHRYNVIINNFQIYFFDNSNNSDNFRYSCISKKAILKLINWNN